MRVLALVTDGFGMRGGIGRYNSALLSALSASPVIEKITVLPRFCSSDLSIPPKIEQLSASPNALMWCARASMIAVRERPDILFCGHLNSVTVVAAIARLLSRPMWLQVHGIEAWTDRGIMIRRAAERAQLVTSVSRYTRHRLLSWVRINPARTRVLPNTVSAACQPRQSNPNLVTRYGIQNRKIIITVGRMDAAERYKGHDRIIRCLPDVRRQIPNLCYLIVGSGDDQARLESIAREEGVEDIVIFAGPVREEELPDYYALADVFAMPSTGEGFGIVFIEAAMSGLQVIGGNRDGSVDALADGVVGLAVDPEKIGALTDALVTTLQCRTKSVPESAKRFAFENFVSHVDLIIRDSFCKSINDGLLP